MVVDFKIVAKFAAVIAGTAAVAFVANKVVDKVVDKVHYNSEPVEENNAETVEYIAKETVRTVVVSFGVGAIAFMLYKMGWEYGLVDGMTCAARDQMTMDDVSAIIGSDEAFRYVQEETWKAVHK